MAMGTRKHRQRQEQLWVTHAELATGPGHPFYTLLNELLDREKFDEFAEAECAEFYAEKNGRPSLTPADRLLRGRGFRTWHCVASRRFVGVASVLADRPG